MTDPDLPAEGDRALDPDEVAARSFPTAFRGFDPVQVRAFLGDVADELRRLRDQEASLRWALEQQETPAPTVDQDQDVDPAPVLAATAAAAAEAEEIVEGARVEADRLLKEARERVEQLGAAATAETTRVLDEARAEAARLRATATDDLKGRFEEAEATAVRKIAEAEREAAAIRVKAREEAEATIEAARDRGREMVAEAQAARERMLADLAKRKRAAQAQLEQLRAGRDRLLDTLKVARRSIDEMTTRFDASEGAATTPPSSGVPAGSVTTTPGLASTDARPRAASSPPAASEPHGGGAAERPRPVRARAVALGEAPTAPRPSIAAPQARVAVDPKSAEALPERTPGPPPAGVPEASAAPTPSPGAAPSVERVAELSPAPAAPRNEERRSSALRILRRNKPQDAASPPPLIGRDSPGEGVRIIGRPAPAAGAPAPEAISGTTPEVAPLAAPPAEAPPAEAPLSEAPLSEPQLSELQPPATEPQPEPEVVAVAAVEAPAVVPADPGEIDEGRATPDEPRVDGGPVEPLAVEEIRPRIEDLFARIRADREAATASARQVLADAGADDLDAPEAASGSGAATAADRPASTAEAGGAISVATDADEHRLQVRDAITEPLVAQLTKRLKRALQDEQNATLDRLRTSRRPAQVDQVLSRRDDQATPYRHLALPFLDEAARGGAAASPHGPIAVATDDLAAQLADDLAGAVRARLDAVLQAAASDDLDLSSLSERISSVYREWKVQKLERLATHYLIAAHERGGFLAHPEGAPLRWLVDDDGPCPDCDDNALAGPTPRGEAFPTGQLHPPAHLGCRCLLAPSPT